MESMSVQVHAVIKVKGGAQRIQRIDIYGNSLTSIKASTFHINCRADILTCNTRECITPEINAKEKDLDEGAALYLKINNQINNLQPKFKFSVKYS